MKVLSGMMKSLIIGLAALLGGCNLPGAPEVRYRVIVEVERGGVVHTGSSVWSWSLKRPRVALASPHNGKFQGEAVAVDLGDGQTLFAILRGDDAAQGAAQMIPERVFGNIGRSVRGEPRRFGSDRVRDLRDIASRTGERREIDCRVNPSWCPMLVTFRDIEDPTTVGQVDPFALDKTFGAGLRLKRILVELTDEPVTHGIEKRLDWLSSQSGALLKRPKRVSIREMPLAGRLTEGDFWRG